MGKKPPILSSRPRLPSPKESEPYGLCARLGGVTQGLYREGRLVRGVLHGDDLSNLTWSTLPG